ncbi:Smr/MutS family protein [Phenylobacterium sp.]|uniref:Smr/MutS family protein n=1 Tax=Phenylobacterium sp. TaxID=1871053 RepID=UPI00398379CB
MKRPLKPEEVRVWGVVAATVHPLPGRSTPKTAEAQATKAQPAEVAARIAPPKPVRRQSAPAREAVDGIEPRRKRRIARERDPIGARLDLHGLDQDRAKVVLEGFIRRAWEDGYRAVLIITGKGVQGDGVLRRRTPEWLAAPSLAGIVAGISEAHRTHGGEGALYVALKRRPRG